MKKSFRTVLTEQEKRLLLFAAFATIVFGTVFISRYSHENEASARSKGFPSSASVSSISAPPLPPIVVPTASSASTMSVTTTTTTVDPPSSAAYVRPSNTATLVHPSSMATSATMPEMNMSSSAY